MEKEYQNLDVTIEYNGSGYFSELNGIDFNEVKVCYVDTKLAFFEKYCKFKNKSDISYALQEWNATMLCLFGSAENIKFINPYRRPVDCFIELECIKYMGEAGLDTSEMYLTNISRDLIDIYEMNPNLLIKRPIMGYGNAKNLTPRDFKKLDKLHYSPYILQKGEEGLSVTVTLIGDEYLACDVISKEKFIPPLGIIERLQKIKELTKSDIISFYAMKSGNDYKFFTFNQSPLYDELYQNYGKDFVEILEKMLIKEYNR